LSKVDSSHWPELVLGDTRGTRIFAAEHLSEISNQLEKFTTDKVQFGLQSTRNTSFHRRDAVPVWSLLWSTVCLSVCHNFEFCWNGWTDSAAFEESLPLAYCTLCDKRHPFPQIDIGAMMIVSSVRGKTIRSVLYSIVCSNSAHTYDQT